jgi:eukaryotic-like serine/threonine-protein kinase
MPRDPSALQPPSSSEVATLPPSAVVAESPLIPLPVSGDAVTLPPEPAPSEGETLAPTTATTAGEANVAVPGYEILGELGRGAMGVVYKARQGKLGRLVALKMILSGGHAGEADLPRFRTEAEAIARLQHPNIVQIHEVGEHGGLPYFSLEFCAGGSLEKKLAGTPLQPKEAAALVETLARGMNAAHQKGVIHRDLKPANVLLAEDGTPKVTDFGLAKKLDEAGQTASGAIIGTPSYMAPEQAAGQNREIGPAADVYGLGALLYECLTGRPPFRAATALETILQVLKNDAVPVRELQPKVARDLETICLKCLHKDPAKRYATAAALCDDLGRYLDGLPVLARPPGGLERAGRWARRHPGVAAVAAVSLAAGMVLLVLGLIYDARLATSYRQAEGLRGDLVVERERAREATSAAERSQAAAEQALYRARFSAGWQAYNAANIPRASEHLDLAPVAQRRWEWNLLRHLCFADAGTLAAHDKGALAVAWAPSGKMLASGAGNTGVADAPAELHLRDFTEGTRRHDLVGHKGAVTSVAFSPDGLTLASASARTNLRAVIGGGPLEAMNRVEGEVILWDVTSKKKREQLEGYGAVAFSKDGKLLAWVGLDNAVRIRDAGGASVRPLPAHDGPVCSLAFGPNRLLASVSLRVWREGNKVRFLSQARVFDVTADKQLWEVERDGEELDAVAFDPAGKRLALAGLDGRIRILEAATGRELAILLGHQEAVLSLAWSPDGTLMASGSKDRTIRLWGGGSGREWAVLRGHAAPINSLAFTAAESPGDWRLVSGDGIGRLKFWDSSGPGYRALRGHTAGVRQCAFSPDGATLATASADGTVRLWDRHTGKVRHVLACHAEKVAFSPDSRTMATAEANALEPNKPGRVRLWPVEGGEPRLLYTDPKHPVLGVAFSPDGAHLAVVSGALQSNPPVAGKALVLAVGDGRIEGECQGDLGVAVAVAYRPDGQELAVAGWNGRVQTFAPTGGKPLRTCGAADNASITALAYRGDGLLAFANQNGVLGLAAQTGDPPRSIPAANGAIYALSFHPGGDRLAVASLSVSTNQGEVRLLDEASGYEMLALPGQMAAAFSPDGRTLAAPWAENVAAVPEVRLWDAPDGRERYAIRTEEGAIFTVAAGPDGELWSAHDAGSLHKWKTADGTPLSSVRRNERTVSALALSTDGKLLASVDDTGTILLGQASGGGTPRPLEGHTGLVFGMAFDREARRLVSAGRDDFTVRVWSVETGKEQVCLRGHNNRVWRAVWSPDGQRVASVDVGGRLIVWDVEKQSNVWDAQAHATAAIALAMRPDGKELATGGTDGLVRVWEADSGRPLRTLRGHGGGVTVLAYGPTAACWPAVGTIRRCACGMRTMGSRCSYCAGTQMGCSPSPSLPTARPCTAAARIGALPSGT